MSLITDKVFYSALKSSEELVQAVDGRIHNVSIQLPDDEYLNESVPYIIIAYDGMQNMGFCKDNSYEGCTDDVKITIEVAARSREELGKLTTMIRNVIIAFFESDDHPNEVEELIPNSYTLSASPVNFDSLKPCFFQSLVYQCDTNP